MNLLICLPSVKMPIGGPVTQKTLNPMENWQWHSRFYIVQSGKTWSTKYLIDLRRFLISIYRLFKASSIFRQSNLAKKFTFLQKKNTLCVRLTKEMFAKPYRDPISLAQTWCKRKHGRLTTWRFFFMFQASLWWIGDPRSYCPHPGKKMSHTNVFCTNGLILKLFV